MPILFIFILLYILPIQLIGCHNYDKCLSLAYPSDNLIAKMLSNGGEGSVIFINENEHENGEKWENNKFVNEN